MEFESLREGRRPPLPFTQRRPIAAATSVRLGPTTAAAIDELFSPLPGLSVTGRESYQFFYHLSLNFFHSRLDCADPKRARGTYYLCRKRA